MEVIEGRNLKEMIRERAPFTVYEAFAIGRQVASALDFAHKRGLVHRDVKPQNILVTPEGVAKVTDFGIARSLSASQLTRTGMVIGTVHYFSPEQAQGKPTGPPTDIYALGIILYEMLTGRLPFEADNAIGVAMQQVHNEPPSPLLYNSSLPARPIATVMRALEKDPERRYRDAGEFAAALSEPLGPARGGTTSFAPIVEPTAETTTVYQPVAPPVAPAVVPEVVPPVRRTVVRETKTTTPTTILPPSNPWRTTLIVLGALLALVLIAGASFLVANNAFQASAGTSTPTPTSTPTATATPRPKKHRVQRPTPVPTSAPVVFPATDTPIPPPPPTATSTPKPLLPTSTPVPTPPPPRPTRTPVPTSTPQQPVVTIVPIGPTPSPTGNG